MTMYLDATRLTFGLRSDKATRSRILITRDHIVTIEEADNCMSTGQNIW